MPLNATENYLRDRKDHVLINFAGQPTAGGQYLAGPGGYAGDGYPQPAPGQVVRLYVWDGSSLRTSAAASSFEAGDRLSVQVQADPPWYQVMLRINGADSGTYCNLVLTGAWLQVSALVRLDIY
ncbi:MAG: hypothetical protein C4524_12775 [Candidatus Zixiibacteriota bacterium]|nr:MAG: hypothetical protein C4524_12775 [candidate division Zixibacteria bacterium]